MQKYRVGTIISKQFEVPGQQKLRYYRGEVSAYYPEHQLYCVVYEDGDSEEMEEEYVTFYLAAALKKKTSPNKKRENMVEKCWRNSLLAAADKTIELAKSPQRKKNAAVVDATSMTPESGVHSEDVAAIERGCTLADVFDEHDDGDDEKNQVPEMDRLPIRNNLSFGLSDTESVDETFNTSGAVTDIHTDINFNTDTAGAGGERAVTAEKHEHKHQKVSFDTLPRLGQQIGGMKYKNESLNQKKRKAPVLPMQTDSMKCASLRSSEKNCEVIKSTKGDVLTSCTRVSPKDANADRKNNSAYVEDQLSTGDTVYAAWWSSNKRDQSYIMFRGTVKATRFDESSHSYDVAFDDGKCCAGIDKSLVMSEHRYLNQNLKPILKVGQRVVAAWWEDPTDTSKPALGWFPGVIKACKQLKQGGLLGPDRFYDVIFDDDDELDDIEDIFVFPEEEYDLLGREASGTCRWKGVRNVLSKTSNDRYAQTVGYWVVEEFADTRFPSLGDALRFYDDLIVSRKGAKVKNEDLNLPEEWDIDSEERHPPNRSSFRSISNNTRTRSISNDTSGASTGGERNESEVPPQPASPAPTELIPSGVVCLRGNLKEKMRNGVRTHRITGLWSTGLDKILADPENRSGACNRFVYDRIHESSKSSGVENPSSPSGRYSGSFIVESAGSKTKIDDKDVVFNFVENNEGYYNLEGTGYNAFGRYTMSGFLTKDGVVTIHRHYHYQLVAGQPTTTKEDAVPQAKLTPKKVIQAGDGEEMVSRISQVDNTNDSQLAGVLADAEGLSAHSSTPIDNLLAKQKRIIFEESKSDRDTEQLRSVLSNLREECRAEEKKRKKNTVREVTPLPPAESEQSYKTPSSKSYPTASKSESEFPATKASDCPDGWLVRTVPRKKGNHVDRYFYSPKLGIRFRSKVEVARFLDCLAKHQGDEEEAWSALGKRKAKPVTSKAKRKRPSGADASVERPHASSAAKKESSSTNATNGSPRCPRREIKIVGYVGPRLESSGETQNSEKKVVNEIAELSLMQTSPCNKRTKPSFHRGEKVYAAVKGNDPSSSGTREWLPGRIWDYKVKHETTYGPVKAYDIIFDDGEVARNLDEVWVMKEEDHEVLSAKPNEFSWIGVQRCTDRSANDEYARTVGWYETYFGGEHHVYSSISDAMRSYDKYIISKRDRDLVSEKELNFPLELKN
mmetsp:Transcript_21573/g.35272  ORF Transcript_21573/g.35272 Transcript_21573/m.35272 type:complete len:1185 (-) Transcript_21573:86-3640(-)